MRTACCSSQGCRVETTQGTGYTTSPQTPNVIVHLKKGIEADVPATARVITDPHEARPLIEAAARRWRRDDVDDMIAHSPLIVLTAATAPAA